MDRFGSLSFFIGIFLVFLAGDLFAAKKFASPTGTPSNTGLSESSPWSLAFAFGGSSPLVPGDSLILLDGVYEGNYLLNTSGSAQKPIRILPQNEGKAIFDVGKNRTGESAITINGSNVWLIGLHLTSSSTIKREDLGQSVPFEAGITVFGSGVKLINCWIYDIAGGGLQLWRPALDLEVYGCLVFNNGTQASTRGTGHGMYIQHDEPDFPKIIRNNIVFQNASQGINSYTTNPPNGGVIFSENTAFNTGVIANYNPALFRAPHNFTIGSQNNVSFEMKVKSNVFYSDLQQGRLEKNQVGNVTLGRTYAPNRGIYFTDNLIYGGQYQVEIQPLENLQFVRNSFYNLHGKFFQFLTLASSLPQTTWESNTYFNLIKDPNAFTGFSFSEWKSNSGFDQTSLELESVPEQPRVAVRKNEYDPSRFYVTVINPAKRSSIEIDLEPFGIRNGTRYELIDLQNPFDPESRLEGTYLGSPLILPMSWTKSLAPKGNMPHAPIHTDAGFGVFQLRFTDEVVEPDFRAELTVELDQDGKAVTTLQDYLENGVQTGWQVEFSRSPTYSCGDLEGTENQLKIKDSKGNVWSKTVLVKIKDTIAPKLIPKIPVLEFDLTKGFLELEAENFVTSLSDNCGIKSLELNKTQITCENYNAPIELILTARDFSGNTVSKTILLHVTAFESKKISISPESGTQILAGSNVELKLGHEFDFQVENWYRSGQVIPGEKGKAILTDQPGTYWAKLIPNGDGCPVESQKTEIRVSDLPFGEVKESVSLVLGPDGKADLGLQQVFVNWPMADPTLEISFSKTIFNCENTGENEVIVQIKKPGGDTWEKKTVVIVQDQAKPVLVPKNVSLELDVTKGIVEIIPENVLAEFGDNCGLKSLTINKNRFACEDLDKEFSVVVRAEDHSGNVAEAVAVVSVVRVETGKVILNGKKEICEGEKSILELSSPKAFEVVRWRRNGAEIPGQDGKVLEAGESGSYHAEIRYVGGCLSETEALEVTVQPKAKGEISVDGNILTAPEGSFTYQWLRNGEPIEGAISRAYTAQLMGEYAVEVTNQAGCKSRLDPVTLTISGLGGKPAIPPIELRIYPNPATDRVILELPDGVLASKAEVSVFSSDGKNITSSLQISTLNDSKVEILLNKIAKGTYVIWIVGEDQKAYFGKVVLAN